MRKQLLLIPLTLALALLARTAAQAQSGPFFQAITNLHPVAYWPLHEAVTTLTPDFATNSGTLGAAGNGFYFPSGVTRGQAGALTDGDTAILTDGSAGLVTFPYSSTVLSNNGPFSAEGWFVCAQSANTQCAMSSVDANNPRSGWLLYANGVNPGTFNFRMYNQNGTTPSLNISSPTSGITVGQYYHVVVVYDGTAGYLYVNGALANSNNPTGFVANDGANFTIGQRSDRIFQFQGVEDEIALYTNALSAATILAHYMAGTNPAPVTPYKQLVLQSNPILYYRLDEPDYTAPPITSNPLAPDYGSLGSAVDGYYLPGSAPASIAGPTFTGFSNGAACHFNNAYPSGIVEIPDSGSALNILGPVTMTAWLKGDPGNIGPFQSYAGRGDPSFRGDVDGSGNAHFADGTNPDVVGSFVNDGRWHFVVGTWDTNNLVLYIDGVSNRTQSAGTAIPGSTLPFVIGGDGGYSVGASPSRIFNGGVTEVAVFDTNLTSGQISNLYNAALVPPYLLTQPSNSIYQVNASGSLYVNAGGTPTLGYQWYKGTTPVSNGGGISGATTPTLTFNPVALGNAGSYKVVVSNPYGSATSSVVSVTVISGPVINPDLPATNHVYIGTTATLNVGLAGTGPFTNAWKYNGVNLVNGGRISGVNTPTLTIANAQASDSGIYQFWSTNGIGVSSSTAGRLVVDNILGFNGSGAGWTLNTGPGTPFSPVFVGNNRVQMTQVGQGGQSTALWFNTPVYAGAFKAFFTYFDVTDGADGVCFVLQNAAAGPTATGSGGGGMGVRTITNSFEVELDLYNEGFAYNTNGLTHEAGDGFPAGMTEFQILGTGDDVGSANQAKDMTIFYDGNNLSLTFSNQSTHATGTTNFVIGDIKPALLGSTAYVGFTGACGGVDDTQIVSDFAYIPLAPQLSIAPDGTGGIYLSWPALPAYSLQQNSSIANYGGWTPISGPYTTVPGQGFDQYQVHVTPAAGMHFYRLLVTP
jgi:hypothetical protein